MMIRYNLLLSYVKEDNLSSNSGNGWVDDLQKYLQLFIGHLSNKKIHISTVETSKEANNDIFGVIPIISEKYLDSQIYKKDLTFVTETKCNLFSIQKEPLKKSRVPKELSSTLPYNFFEKSIDSEVNFTLFQANVFNKNYWLKLVDLAFDIIQCIEDVESDNKEHTHGQTVFLAETSYDQNSNRDTLIRELKRYGHTILPDKPLSNEANELEKEIQGYLKQCSAIIHMIGADYGEIVENTDKSIVELQNNIADKFNAAGSSLIRYIWIPPNVRPIDDKQAAYINILKEGIGKLANSEVIQVPLEVLKSILQRKLQQNITKTSKKGVVQEPKNGKNLLYLVFDKSDAEDAMNIKDSFTKENYKVIPSVFDGDQMNLIQTHRDNLVQSNAVLIYSKHSNKQWLDSKINDVLKSPGFGKTSPFDAKAIYAPDKKINASKIKEQNDLVFLQNLDKNTITSFLGKLK